MSITVAIRKTNASKAIILVHGFKGDSYYTFGMLPAFIAGSRELAEWDIHSVGYPSSLAPDISGVWSADPDLPDLTSFLITQIRDSSFKHYSELAIIAHSMGGLIVQKAVLDGDFVNRIRHVYLFGTPSAGLRKAGLGRIFKRQSRDMTYGGPFIKGLREAWSRKFTGELPFHFKAIAGIRDEFVPSWSSVEPFDPKYQCHVQGNHLEIVKPQTLESDSYVLLMNLLRTTEISQSSQGQSRPQAGVPGKESLQQKQERVIAQLFPQKQNLDASQLGELALALELVGRQPEAIELLEARHSESTDLTGILAGRLKRRWLADPDGRENEGDRARELYRQAFEKARELGDHKQAFYNGINCAFMELALKDSKPHAQLKAAEVLQHCRDHARQDPRPDMWRSATEGEAHIYLGDMQRALNCYSAAVKQFPDSRQSDSMLQQALWASRLMNIDAESQLRSTIQQNEPQ